MDRMPHMVDMSISPEEAKENMFIPGDISKEPRYPYGLSICLTQKELDKLNVDYSDWQVGDHFHIRAMSKITSISENETEGGKTCRIEMQIVALSGENEELEDDEEEGERSSSY